MSIDQQSQATELAHSHALAWSRHDWDTAREGLAADVHVTATTTLQDMPQTDLTGVDEYMRGLKEFAEAVTPGSAEVIAIGEGGLVLPSPADLAAQIWYRSSSGNGQSRTTASTRRRSPLVVMPPQAWRWEC